MEHRTNERSDDQRQAFPRDAGNEEAEKDVQVAVMDRGKREEALAWAQAYRLIRGGVDEVVQIIEGSQYTIELLLQMLSEAACRQCELHSGERARDCGFCQRREELLARLA